MTSQNISSRKNTRDNMFVLNVDLMAKEKEHYGTMYDIPWSRSVDYRHREETMTDLTIY